MKRIINKVTVCVLCTAMVGGICYAQSAFSGKEETALAAAQSLDVRSLVKESNSSITVKSTNAEDSIEKEEVVYVKMNADGSVTNCIVSDWLKNFANAATITDQSTLKDITNIKGDELFTTNSDGTISWAANGNDIYYQGTTTKDLPFQIKVTYLLDGKEISASDVVGKSGNLTMKLSYESKEDIPFSIIATTTARTDMIKNLTAKNAKVISDGDKYIIVGIALCGVKDNLQLESIEIPEEIVLEGEVTDFDPMMVLNVITTGILSNIELDNDLNLTDLSDSMETLNDSCIELQKGSATLSSSLNEFGDKSEEFLSGVSALANGTTEYTNGVSLVIQGVKELHEKSATLIQGINALSDGATALSSGAKDANTGIKALTSQFKELVNGSKAVKEGLDSLKQLTSGLSDGKAKENAVFAQLMQTVDNNEKIISALKAANADATMIATLEKNTAAQRQIATGLQTSGKTLSAYLDQLDGAVTKLSDGATSLYQGCSSTDAAHEQLQAGLSKLTEGSNSLSTGITSLSEGSKALKAGIDKLYAGVTKLEAATSSLTNGSAKLTESNQLMGDAILKLKDGSKELSNGMNRFYEEGISQIYNKYNDTVSVLDGKLEDLIEKGENYKCFTELSEEMDGNVKFIVEIQ